MFGFKKIHAEVNLFANALECMQQFISSVGFWFAHRYHAALLRLRESDRKLASISRAPPANGHKRQKQKRANVTKMRNGAAHFYRRPTHAYPELIVPLFAFFASRGYRAALAQPADYLTPASSFDTQWHWIPISARLISMRVRVLVLFHIARDLALVDFIIMSRLHANRRSKALNWLRAHYHTNRNVSLCRRAHLAIEAAKQTSNTPMSAQGAWNCYISLATHPIASLVC